jgi:rhamnose utilization protein RhaD (predicted bifunctional aldolase and dehydrogenase)/NAD(P)-dependent dehydrogenase (short-subunit alcohol dehydrogenase family)
MDRGHLMKSLWSDAEAGAVIARYADRGVSEDLALRVYSSRLLGVESRLVQHGGGNTSLKTTLADVFGAPVDVLCVKGSGWDLGDIEPEGLPAVRMGPLLDLRRLNSLSDEAMVDAQRGALISSSAPNPSVETLLHAWIPERYIDHTHANAVLSLTDQPDGEALCLDLYGERLALVSYCMPGFSLAQLAAGVFEAHPKAEGMVLLKHGIFTWGESAQIAYERMIEHVSRAEARLTAGVRTLVQVRLPKIAPLSEIAPAVRGALAEALGDGRFRRVVLEHRASPALLAFAGGEAVARDAQAGPVTPDHVIRIKPWPLILPAPTTGDEAGFAQAARAAVADYADRYRAYFERHNATATPKKTMLDPWPRWVLVPGVGLFGAGASRKEAAVAADVAETTAKTITAAEAIGRFESITEADLFDMEYWSLEQAKLGKAKPLSLAGQAVAVTGGGGTIGAAIATAFAAQGAAVAVLDRDGPAAERTAKAVKGLAITCDVTDAAQVSAAFQRIAETFGGLDILVSNAGAAFTGAIGEVDDAVLRESFELNFFAHQSAAQAAVRIMRRQTSGGALLFNVSKQAVNPGPDFGPYGLAKAATLSLMRQYAVEYGAAGIRSNAVNADRIRSGLLTDEMVTRRSAARGVSERNYLSGNLLGREVAAEDVAQAFVSLALAEKTTAAVLTVDGGNIAAAMR